MKNICLTLLVFCGVSIQFSFGNVTNVKVETTFKNNLASQTFQYNDLSNKVSKSDSLITSNKPKKSKAYRVGLTSFGLVGLSYLVYFVLGRLGMFLGWAILPYLFIGMAIIGLIAVGLSIRSLVLYKKEKSKKGIVWPSLALILGIIPAFFLILVILALRTFN